MKALGLNANEVSTNIGKVGLTGTLDQLTEAILKNSKGGQTLAASFNGMTPAAKNLAYQILTQKVSYEQATTAAEGMSVQQQGLIASFAKTAGSATGLKETVDGAMKTMTGGATGLNVALLLSGKHASTFASNVQSVADAARKAGPDVSGWGAITSDTAFKMDQAKVSVENLGTSVGLALLPAVNKLLTPLDEFVGWVGRSKVAVDVLVGAIGAALAGYAIVKAVEGFQRLGKAFSAMQSGLTTLASRLGITTAATEEQTAATEAQAAATGEAEVAQDGLNLAMLANPVVLIVAALAVLVVAFVELWKHCAAFRDFWKDLWKDIEHVADEAWHFLGGVLKGVVQIFAGAWDLVRDATRDLWEWLTAYIRAEVGIVLDVVSWFSRLGGLFRGWWDDAVRAVEGAADTMIGFVRRLPGDILHALGDLGSLLWNAGKAVIEGLIHGIESAVGGLMSTVSSIGSDISGAFKSVMGIFSPSRVFTEHGRDIVRGLVNGINAEGPSAISAIRNLGGQLGMGGGGGGFGMGGTAGSSQLVVTGAGAANWMALVKAIWPDLQLEVRHRGGGGIYSAQKAFGRVWPQG
jgi:phage-related protein